MSESRTRTEAGNKIFMLKNSNAVIRRAKVRQLQKELDSLALLLEQVKKQTDRVGAAADAIGDAVIGDLEMGIPSFHDGHSRQEGSTFAPEDERTSQRNGSVGIANKTRRIAAGVRFAN